MYEKTIRQLLMTGVRADWIAHAPPVNSLAEIRERLAGREFPDVDKLTLFGSFASGKNREESDIDILIDCQPEFNIYLFTLELEKILGRLCDIVELDSCRPWVRNRILASPLVIVYESYTDRLGGEKP